MMVVEYLGFRVTDCGDRTVGAVIAEDVPVGMLTVHAETWFEVKEKILAVLEKSRPQKGLLEVWEEVVDCEDGYVIQC